MKEECNLVPCLLMMEIKEEKETKKKVQFTDNVEKPMESVVLCTINRETFHSFTKNMPIGNLGAYTI